MLEWLALALVVVGYLGVYSAWTAGRLDRLHLRLDAARSALDQQLRDRAEAAGVVPELRAAAAHCVSLSLEGRSSAMALGREREQAENALSRAIRGITPTAELADAVAKAGFARHIHNDAVRDALVLRRRWVVRLLHLAGHAPRPTYFEIDDAQFSDVAAVMAPYD